MMKSMRWRTSVNARREWVPHWGVSNYRWKLERREARIARNRQQIGVGGAWGTCKNVVAKKKEKVSWLKGVQCAVCYESSWWQIWNWCVVCCGSHYLRTTDLRTVGHGIGPNPWLTLTITLTLAVTLTLILTLTLFTDHGLWSMVRGHRIEIPVCCCYLFLVSLSWLLLHPVVCTWFPELDLWINRRYWRSLLYKVYCCHSVV